MKRVAIITSSDMGFQGKREDLSGPAIKEIAEREGYQVVSMDILPDDRAMLSRRMAEIADENQAELIIGHSFPPKRNHRIVLYLPKGKFLASGVEWL